MPAIDENLPQSSNSPLFISRALKNCLMDQASTYSGTSNAQMNSGRRCSANDSSGFPMHLLIQLFASRFFGQGTLGCTATQVQEKIVTRQLQTIFQIILQCARSLQWFPANEQFSTVGMGPASIETLKQVIEKEQKEHEERDWLMRRLLFKCFISGAEYSTKYT